MGVDYAISRFLGLEIPEKLNEEDKIILENLIKNWLVVKPEYEKYIFLNESKITIHHGRLVHFIKERLGEPIYPKTYVKEIDEKDYGSTFISEEVKEMKEVKEELSKLSFQPEYKYYEYARIC